MDKEIDEAEEKGRKKKKGGMGGKWIRIFEKKNDKEKPKQNIDQSQG